MITSLPSPRYERKFVTETLDPREVMSVVRRHPALFYECFPPRVVNNLYLDSPDLCDYHNHVSGVASRTKTRIRWYGPWGGKTLEGALEQKLKAGLISGKQTHPLPSLFPSHGNWRALIDQTMARADLPPVWRARLDGRQPSLLNRYHRHYFLSADRRFRLTVDSSLAFASARPGAGTAPAFAPPTSTVVLELKYGQAEAEVAPLVTNALPLRMARCSKYVLGIDAVR